MTARSGLGRLAMPQVEYGLHFFAAPGWRSPTRDPANWLKLSYAFVAIAFP